MEGYLYKLLSQNVPSQVTLSVVCPTNPQNRVEMSPQICFCVRLTADSSMRSQTAAPRTQHCHTEQANSLIQSNDSWQNLVNYMYRYMCTNLLLAMIKLEAVMKTHYSPCNKEIMTIKGDIYMCIVNKITLTIDQVTLKGKLLIVWNLWHFTCKHLIN